MDIPVVSAVGRGPTELAAFDAALVAAVFESAAWRSAGREERHLSVAAPA